jgi:hypothetical protein
VHTHRVTHPSELPQYGDDIPLPATHNPDSRHFHPQDHTQPHTATPGTATESADAHRHTRLTHTSHHPLDPSLPPSVHNRLSRPVCTFINSLHMLHAGSAKLV